MESIKHIEKDGVRYASFFHAVEAPGPRFLSRTEDEFQFGVIERPKGHVVPVHAHPVHAHRNAHMSEFIYVERGKMEIEIFDEEWNAIGSDVVSAGDFMISYRGGHGLTMLEPTRIIEVKQGPYPGADKAKIFRDKDAKGY